MHDRAAAAAELGSVIVGLHLEFLNGVDRWLDRLVGRDHDSAEIVVVVRSVQGEYVLVKAGPVDAERVLDEVLPSAGQHAGGQHRQFLIVPAVQRHLRDRRVLDGLTEAGGLGLEQGQVGRHFDGLGHSSHLQLHVHASAGPGVESDVRSQQRLETLARRAQVVVADWQGRENVVAGLAALRAVLQAVGLVDCLHLRPGHRRSRRICDQARDRGRVSLRPSHRCSQQASHCTRRRDSEVRFPCHGSMPPLDPDALANSGASRV